VPAVSVTVCSSSCDYTSFDAAFDSLLDGDTLVLYESYAYLVQRTVLKDNLTIWSPTSLPRLQATCVRREGLPADHRFVLLLVVAGARTSA
jgi:hypothetical protein